MKRATIYKKIAKHNFGQTSSSHSYIRSGRRGQPFRTSKNKFKGFQIIYFYYLYYFGEHD